MVVLHQAGTTKTSARAAKLTAHDKRTARIARGLEPALLDNERVPITAFETTDTRRFDLRVAGPAALLTAKAIKIAERLQQADQQPDRLKEKDALDMFRVLQTVETLDLVSGFKGHIADEHAAVVTNEALDLLRAEGVTVQGRIPVLAAAAAQGDPTVAPAFAALTGQLLAAM